MEEGDSKANQAEEDQSEQGLTQNEGERNLMETTGKTANPRSKRRRESFVEREKVHVKRVPETSRRKKRRPFRPNRRPLLWVVST